MSKSVKRERTQGYLDSLCRARKERKAVRTMKAELLDDIQEVFFNPPVLAQDF